MGLARSRGVGPAEPPELRRIVELVRGGRRFLVTCHVQPDGDGLGSMLALAAILRAGGADVTTYNPDPVPLAYRFLPGAEQVRSRLPRNARFDAAFVCDTASRSLVSRDFPPRERTGPVVVLDHHAAFDADFGDVVFRDASACATAELVVTIGRALGVEPLPLGAATAVYAAVVTDTGGFRYSATRPATLRMAADLLERGVDPWEVAYNVFEGWLPERLELLRLALGAVRHHDGGRIAVMTVTRRMLQRAGATDEMVEGLVNYARMIRGVEVAALVWEREPEVDAAGRSRPVCKVSLRAQGAEDVSRIAVALGGGGHRSAAGARVCKPAAAVRALVVAEARRLLAAPSGA